MNALQMRMRIDELNDRVKSPRFTDDKYYSAINQAIQMVVNDRIDNIKTKKEYSVQSIQRIRDELYTLVTTSLPAIIAPDIAVFPTDYYQFLFVECIINGIQVYTRPTNFNSLGPLKENSFKKPSDTKPYFIEFNNGLKIYHGTSTLSNVILIYIKIPNIVSIGNEGQKLTNTSGNLIHNANYYVYDESVHNGITYYDGELFTSTGNIPLTSGTVIRSTNVVNCDLPIILQNEVIRMASAIMNGTIESYNKKQDLLNDNKFS